MQPSLSVLLPVYNVQRSLGQILARMIEILPEIAARFEVLVIDDGSTDATGELAHEMAVDYPQLAVVAHPCRLGMATAIRTGLARTSGDMVLIRDEECRVDLYDIPRLWRFASTHDIVLSKIAAQSAAGAIPRLPAGMMLRMPGESRPGLQLLHRRVTRGWLTLGGPEELMSHLLRKGYPIQDVEVREENASIAPLQMLETMAQHWTAPLTSVIEPMAIGPRRPNYLARLKAFALGE